MNVHVFNENKKYIRVYLRDCTRINLKVKIIFEVLIYECMIIHFPSASVLFTCYELRCNIIFSKITQLQVEDYFTHGSISYKTLLTGCLYIPSKQNLL